MKRTKYNHDEIIKLYRNERMSVSEVAIATGCTAKTINKIIRSNKIKRHKKCYVNNRRFNHDKMCELFKSGTPIDDLVKISGYAEVTVRNILIKNDIVIPKKERKIYKRRPKKGQAMRTCVRCDKEFLSDGIHNRVCSNCNEVNNGIVEVNGNCPVG